MQDLEFGWRIVLGSVIGFFGAAFGSVGGVGGGGIFVPMLTLIIGFDAKSSTAISKCKIEPLILGIALHCTVLCLKFLCLLRYDHWRCRRHRLLQSQATTSNARPAHY